MRGVVAGLVAACVVSSLDSGGRVAAAPGNAVPAAETSTAPELGFASYYARSFDGKRTASGVRFDSDAMHAAHPVLPFGTIVQVTNRDNGRAVTVTVVDRGPVKRLRDRGVVIDVSRAAARKLDFVRQGKAPVRLEVVSREEP